VSELSALDPRQTLLILDDFHLVDDSSDVQTILARILEFAPGNLSVLVASRTLPSIRAARLTAHGQASRLSTDDLRFSTDETADLFKTAYQLPLEPDLVSEIDARAEGWAASLQLVYSSIRERPAPPGRSTTTWPRKSSPAFHSD
jgi:ATP/maltotriose-dependent transcriptional regulator MalT